MAMKHTLAALAAVILTLALAAALVVGEGSRPARAQVTCPTTLPPAGNFTAANTTQGQFKTNLTSLVAYLTCLLGTDGTTTTAKTTLGLATVATSGSYSDLWSKPTSISGPSSSTIGFVPQWTNTTGSGLGVGLPVGTGANVLLQLNGSGQIPAVDAGLTHGHAILTSSGTHTIASTSEKVIVIGGGGAGGGSDGGSLHEAGGGGSGGVSLKWLTSLTVGNTISVTVGAGGAGASANQGGIGGSSSISSGSQSITTVTANGGMGGGVPGGGSGNQSGGGGASAGSGGDLNWGGTQGANGPQASGNGSAGHGAPGPLGGGGNMGNGRGATGGNGSAPGAGGGGGGDSGSVASTGGNGAAGIVIFEW